MLTPLAPLLDLDREQLGQRRVGDPILDAVDNPDIACAHSGGLHAGLAHVRAMISDAEHDIAIRLEIRQRELIAVVG